MSEIELIRKDVVIPHKDSRMEGLVLSMAFNPHSKKAVVAIGHGNHLDIVNEATREADFKNHPERAIARNELPALVAHQFGFGALLNGAYNNGVLTIQKVEEISTNDAQEKFDAGAALLVQTLEKHGLEVNHVNSNNTTTNLTVLRSAKHDAILKLFKIRK